MGWERIQGVVAPLLTPFEDHGGIAHGLYSTHARDVLAEGAHYLSPFGTTGEATSLSAEERRDTLETLVARSEVEAARLMPGTGLCNFPETVALSRHAIALGCAAVMVLPPFFYSAATEDGLFVYMARLIERVGSPNLRICLYHIPQNTGIGFSPALTARLSVAFPEVVIAYKDSSGDWSNTEAVLASAPGLSVFPASESLLRIGMAQGAAGCISATCNLNSARIRALYEAIADGAGETVEHLDGVVKRFRTVFQNAGLIEGMKAYLAHQTGDHRWLNVRPPLLPQSMEMGEKLALALRDIA